MVMATPFIGEIKMVGFTFAPRGYAECNGQLLPISQNTALYSLLGTTYGGDGTTNFALPNFQDSTSVHFGQGPGLSDIVEGQTGGAANVALISTQLPAHKHQAQGVNGVATQLSPAGNVWAGAAQRPYLNSSNGQMNAGALSSAGGGQPHNNLPPYLVVKFIIALQGIYPSRP
jgi:microcystin-dependent protein